MAKFNRGNLKLKTNQKIFLGDSNESQLSFDNTNLVLSMSSGGISIDSTALIVSGDIHCDDLYTSGSTIHVGTAKIESPVSNTIDLLISDESLLHLATFSTSTPAWFGDNTLGHTVKWTNSEGEIFYDVNIGGTEFFHIESSGAPWTTGTITMKTPTSSVSAGTNSVSTNAGSGGVIAFGLTQNIVQIEEDFLRFGGSNASYSSYLIIDNVAETIKSVIDEVEILSVDSTGVVINGDLKTSGNSIILGSTRLTEVVGGGLRVEGDLSVAGDLVLDSTSAITASEVEYNKITSSTYNTVQDAMDQLGSAGLIDGGVIVSDGTSSVNVTAGTGMLREIDDIHAPIDFIDFPSATGIAIPEDTERDIVVYYNNGNPIVQAVVPGTSNANQYFLLGEVSNIDGTLYISNIRQRISGFSARVLARIYGTSAVNRDGNSGLILGESGDGNRRVSMTSGEVWAILDKESIPAFDTATGDSFSTCYRDGSGGFNGTPDWTTWNNTWYDNGSGFLGTIPFGRWAVNWYWYVPSSDQMVQVYGTGHYSSFAEAEAEAVPTDIPNILSDFGLLIGKIIMFRNATIASEVSSAFDVTYNFSGVTSHGNLANLAAPADDHTQYSLISGTRDFTGTVGGIDPVSSTDFVTLQYMTDLGTDRTRLTYDGTANLDISVEHISDIKYADFDITSGSPAWQEGRVFWDNVNHTFGVYNDESDITLQVGQETHLRVRNESGATIPNGSPVYITGASQGLPTIALAKADSLATLRGVTVASHDIDNTSNGYTTITGSVGNDTTEFIAGDTLYVSDSTAGIMTTERPKSPSIPHAVGFVTSDSVDGKIYVNTTPAEDHMQVMTFSLPLTGVVDTQVPLTGTFREVAAGATGDVATDWAVSNQHAYLEVNSITGSGTVTITGVSLGEGTGVPVLADTETITVDATGYYQSSKKWWEVTNIDIPAGITAINFNYGVVGYPDAGNRNYRVIGYRLDAYSSADTADFTIIINKVQDDGNKKMSIVPIESLSVDSGTAGDQIIDNIRTGGDDRSFNPATGNIWLNNTVLTFKQLDFNTYFTSEENDILSGEGDEGIFIRIEGEPPGSGISSVDFITMYLYFELIP